MTTQTEAERLADALQAEFPGYEVSDLAAAELRRLVSFNQQLMDEVAEQCRINGMSAEREEALRAEVERLNKAQKREWVGLTDEELNDLTAIYSGMPLYRAIEAKLRSKNHD